jgi:Rps23 Pro-64 3,4-dihydroxylase Tpa1-like proline 4-hydroxylase
MQYINPIYTSQEAITKLKNDFANAFPYKHLVMDNFLVEDFANLLHDNFPSIDKLKKHYNGLNEKKSEGANFSDFHPAFLEFRQFLLCEDLAKWTVEVTQIPEVFVTDDKLGAGLHQGGNGSFLDVHIDFNIHAEKNVYRRLNMLVYMNKDWQPEYGGDLEMWDAKMTKCEKKVAPIFNRCVIFETNEISYHGYSKITLPENLTRKSIYTYFYTPMEKSPVTQYHDTVFKAKPTDTTTKKITTSIKETIKNFVKKQLKRVGINI